MNVDLFDFDLPPERIALRPVKPRHAARMLVATGEAPLADCHVHDLPALLRAGDVLVFNDTRVIPAQLEGQRGEARIGATLHKRIDLRRWQEVGALHFKDSQEFAECHGRDNRAIHVTHGSV
jgi:S-adenosylmethionine:tRNA ribosyltransferase-isomerase